MSDIHKCLYCKEVKPCLYTWSKDQYICDSDCFTKQFWQEKVDTKDDPTHFVSERCHYSIGEEPKPGTPAHCLGFGGRSWTVKFYDGRVVNTHNLWCQGGIPQWAREQLPDTAELICVIGDTL